MDFASNNSSVPASMGPKSTVLSLSSTWSYCKLLSEVERLIVRLLSWWPNLAILTLNWDSPFEGWLCFFSDNCFLKNWIEGIKETFRFVVDAPLSYYLEWSTEANLDRFVWLRKPKPLSLLLGGLRISSASNSFFGHHLYESLSTCYCDLGVSHSASAYTSL